MASYITPGISCREFEDWNPGHGLDTIAETAAFIRSQYGVDRVWLIRGPSKVQFRVKGSKESVRAFAALYGESINH